MTTLRPQDDHDFEQFVGRFDALVAPAPAFVERLRARIATESAPLSSSTHPAPMSPVAEPFTSAAASDDLPWRGPRWMRTVEAAVAAVLVIAIGAASVALREPATLYDLAVQPTSDAHADPSELELNYGGDAGHSWVLSAENPISGTEGVGILGGRAFTRDESLAGPTLVVGYSIFMTTFDASVTEGDAFRTIRRMLDEGTPEWTSEIDLFGPFATDGQLLYGTAGDTGDPETWFAPAAIDLETGKLVHLWKLWRGEFAGNTGAVIHNGIVYFGDAFGNVAAVRAGEADPLWTTATGDGTPTNDSQSRSPLNYNPRSDLVVTGAGVFVIRPSNIVVRLDPLTGAESGSFSIVDHLQRDVSRVSLQATGNRLVITADHAQVQEQDEGRLSSIIVLDTDTLDPVAKVTVGQLASNLIVTREWIYLATGLGDGGSMQLSRIGMESGQTENISIQLQADRGFGVGLSMAGTWILYAGTPNHLGKAEVPSGRLVDEGTVELDVGDALYVFPLQLIDRTPATVSERGVIVTYVGTTR